MKLPKASRRDCTCRPEPQSFNLFLPRSMHIPWLLASYELHLRLIVRNEVVITTVLFVKFFPKLGVCLTKPLPNRVVQNHCQSPRHPTNDPSCCRGPRSHPLMEIPPGEPVGCSWHQNEAVCGDSTGYVGGMVEHGECPLLDDVVVVAALGAEMDCTCKELPPHHDQFSRFASRR